ncbi:MAG: fibronectin type III domain-containing protein, partial [Thermodesulfobacteriota bacterium]
NVYLAWQDDTPGNSEIYLKRSTDGGNTWTWKRMSYSSGISSSPSIAVSTAVAKPPAAPSGLTAGSITTTGATLNWTDNSGNEDEFIIGTKTNLGGRWMWKPWGTTAKNATRYSLTGLSPSTTYTFYVRASNTAGYGESSGVTFTTQRAPAVLRLGQRP